MTFSRLAWYGAAAAIVAMVAGACGGGSSSSSSTAPSGTCTPSTNPNTIVIQAGQVCPQTLTIALGGQLTMINNDTNTHQMDSDPHPEHTDCPALNDIGFINPGQTRSSGNLTVARNCGFHDHLNPNNSSLRGTITIR
jgi:hypothetical protein